MTLNKRVFAFFLVVASMLVILAIVAVRRYKVVVISPIDGLETNSVASSSAPVTRSRSVRIREGLDGRNPEKDIVLDSSEREAISILSKGDSEKEKELIALYAEVISSLSSLAEDQRKLAKMRLMVNAGLRHDAVRIARDLMDSDNPDVRRQVVGTLRWYGSGAIIELTQLLSDPDMEVQGEALESWKSVFDEFDDDIKAETLLEVIPLAQERGQVDSLLMSVTKMRLQMGLETVSEIIEANSGAMQTEAALGMWAHLTDSYEYQGPSSVEGYLKAVEDDQREAADKWARIRNAIFEADGDVSEILKLLGIDPSVMEQYMINPQ